MKALHSGKTILAAATVALALAAGANEAHALTDWATSGAVCNFTPNTPGVPGYNANGIYNGSGAGQLSVSCGITTPRLTSLSNMAVRVYDRNSSEEVSCSLYKLDNTGLPVFVQTKGSGIATNSGPTVPITYTTFPGSVSGADFECTIPTVTGSGYSHITSLHYTLP